MLLKDKTVKKRLSRKSLSAWAVTLLCIFSSTAPAAEPSVKFVVPNNQIQTLGIQVTPLQSQAESVRASFPAQVVVPATAEQVVSSPVSGLVTHILVQPNQVVRQGAPLVRISSPELGQLQLQLLQASTRATLARQAAQREQLLFDEGIIPQRRVQETQSALKEASATLNHAKTALRLSGVSAAAIENIAVSGKPLDSITLSATQAGIVTEMTVKPGQRVEAATALLHVVQIHALLLDIQLPVSEGTSWPAGTKVKVPGRDITARILSASPIVSSGSQSVVLRAAIEGKTMQVRPGEFVTVELPVPATSGGWDVPLAAIANEGGQAYVFVRTSDGFEARLVKVMVSAGQRVRVQGPLQAGEQIAVVGVVALKGAWLEAKEKK